MTADRLVIDTTRIRVRGEGDIDLNSGTLDLVLKPRPKKRGLLSLATPARVTGTLADPKIHLTTSGFAKTIFKLSIWAWNLLREMTRKTLPSDGHDICVDPPPRSGVEPAVLQ